MGNDKIDERDLGEWAFEVGERKSSILIYRGVRRSIRSALFPYLRVKTRGEETLNLAGPTILAPVHRSHLDSVVVASMSNRRTRALAKESLFTTRGLGWVCAVLGAIPVRRGEADLGALKSAKRLLDAGESMIVFPEGSRNAGDEIGAMFDGVAWLAARTGAQVIPIGISGTEAAMSEGSKKIRRCTVGVAVGEPLAAPVGLNGKRANRQQMSAFTEELRAQLQAAQYAAVELAAS